MRACVRARVRARARALTDNDASGRYRLDKGHPVHQVSEQDKREVSDEVSVAGPLARMPA